MTGCEAIDPVWDRRCQKDKHDEDEAHVHEEPGDRVTWGSIEAVRREVA